MQPMIMMITRFAMMAAASLCLFGAEAKRALFEAAMLEPEADFIRDRIKEMT